MAVGIIAQIDCFPGIIIYTKFFLFLFVTAD